MLLMSVSCPPSTIHNLKLTDQRSSTQLMWSVPAQAYLDLHLCGDHRSKCHLLLQCEGQTNHERRFAAGTIVEEIESVKVNYITGHMHHLQRLL